MPRESKLSKDEMKRWRERLVYAKKVWTDQGIIGSSAPSTTRMLIEMYRGNQWAHLDNMGVSDSELRTVNKIYPAGNQLLGSLASRNKKVQLFARTPESLASVRGVESLLQYDVIEQNHIRQENAALRDKLFCPIACVRHGFTPRDEFQDIEGRLISTGGFRAARPDRPWIRRVAPWNVLATPSAEAFHPDAGMWWVAFRSLMSIEDIKANPNMKMRDGLEREAGSAVMEWAEQSPYRDPNTDPDLQDMIEVWTVYESKERTWFQLTMNGEIPPIRERDDWPINWETLPVNFLSVSEQMDTPFDVSILENCVPVQEELNLLRTMMSRLARNLRRLVGYQENGIENTELDKLLSADLIEFFKVQGDPQQVLREIQIGGFPQELLLYNGLLEEDLREVLGQSKMGRAQRINVESATEANAVQLGQDLATSRIEEAFHTFQKEVFNTYAQARRETMQLTGEEIVRIVGSVDADGVQQWATVTPEQIAGDYDFDVEIGSSGRRNQDQEVSKAATQFQIAASAPDIYNVAFFARKLVEAMGHDAAQALAKTALTAGAVRGVNTIREQAGLESTPPPQLDANTLALLSGGSGVPQ